MSDEPPNTRLWHSIQELQEIRQHEDVNRRERRRIKNAITELDQARISIKSGTGQ